MENIIGTIVHIRYYDEQSKFIVALIKDEKTHRSMSIAGLMSSANEYSRYSFYGDYVIHPKYGKQFKFDRYEEVYANNYEEIIRYLSSPLFKGIGNTQATHIVEALGDETLGLLKENIDLLDDIKGMTLQKKETIKEVLQSERYDQQVIQFLMEHGQNMSFIEKVLATYKETSMEVITANPYRLIEEVEGIRFKSVDELALSVGVDRQDEQRLYAIVYYTVKEMCYQSGDTYVEYEKLLHQLIRFDRLISEDAYKEAIDFMITRRRLYDYQGRIFAEVYEEAEQNIANTLQQFIGMNEKEFSQTDIEEQITLIEKRDHIQFDDSQKDAIQQFLKVPFMILTGGPGTGKTTIVKAIIDVYTRLDQQCKIALTAPTGRAAKRLSELTGLEGQTIHRLLKWDIQKNEFMLNKYHPIEASLLIVDEFSMVDTILFSKLLDASGRVEKILLIGDHEQLPSVSPGNVLRDLLTIKNLPIIQLDKIYRQKESSGIIKMAHEIRHNTFQKRTLLESYHDIHFMPCLAKQVLLLVKDVVEKSLAEGFDNQDIQILAPMYQGIAGIDALNEMLQNIMNPRGPHKNEIHIGQKLYREGDKILQLKNRFDDNVFNGDIGILKAIYYKDNVEILNDTVVVDYDGNEIAYTSNDFNSFTLAYCMSIHKAQGSEFKIVIMPILHEYHIMLQKKILYTGITRAKKELYLLGEETALAHGLSSYQRQERLTYLKERFLQEEEIKQEDTFEQFFSPYDFMD